MLAAWVQGQERQQIGVVERDSLLRLPVVLAASEALVQVVEQQIVVVELEQLQQQVE